MSEKPMPELSPGARAIVRDGIQHDGPSSGDRERIRASVLAAISTGAAASAGIGAAEATVAAKTAAVSSGAGLAAKLTIAVALVVGGGTGLYLAKSQSSGSDSSQTPAPVTTPATAAQPMASSQPTATPSLQAATPTPAASEKVAPSSVAAPTTRPAATKKSKSERATRAPASSSNDPARASASAPTPPPTNDGSNLLAQLEQERALLDRARAALRDGKPGKALTVLNDYATLVPKPRLAQERSATRVLALCDLGRAAEARKALRAFRQRYPSSAHLTRLETACASVK